MQMKSRSWRLSHQSGMIGGQTPPADTVDNRGRVVPRAITCTGGMIIITHYPKTNHKEEVWRSETMVSAEGNCDISGHAAATFLGENLDLVEFDWQ